MLDRVFNDANDDISGQEQTFDEEPMKNKFELTLINTNAKSLCPKVNSLITCFEELEASMPIVTENWLTDGQSLSDDVEDLDWGRA